MEQKPQGREAGALVIILGFGAFPVKNQHKSEGCGRGPRDAQGEERFQLRTAACAGNGGILKTLRILPAEGLH